jgi:hypothetical protein
VTEHYNSVLEITVSFLAIHKWAPDIYIGPSFCRGEPERERISRAILGEGDFLFQELKECLRDAERMGGMEPDRLVRIIRGRLRRMKDLIQWNRCGKHFRRDVSWIEEGRET